MVIYIRKKLHLQKVSRNYLKQFSSYRADTYIPEITIFNVQSAIIPKAGSAVNVLVFCTLSHNALHLYEILSKYLQRFPTYRVDKCTW